METTEISRIFVGMTSVAGQRGRILARVGLSGFLAPRLGKREEFCFLYQAALTSWFVVLYTCAWGGVGFLCSYNLSCHRAFWDKFLVNQPKVALLLLHHGLVYRV